MSSIWTPSGERPVGGEEPRGTEPTFARPETFGVPPTGEPTDEHLAAELDEALRQLARTPAAVIVVNHAMGLFELARLHLAQDPPNFPEAQLAIDGMAALVEGLTGRLGEPEGSLRDALAQIRLAFVQLRAARETSAPGD